MNIKDWAFIWIGFFKLNAWHALSDNVETYFLLDKCLDTNSALTQANTFPFHLIY